MDPNISKNFSKKGRSLLFSGVIFILVGVLNIYYSFSLAMGLKYLMLIGGLFVFVFGFLFLIAYFKKRKHRIPDLKIAEDGLYVWIGFSQQCFKWSDIESIKIKDLKKRTLYIELKKHLGEEGVNTLKYNFFAKLIFEYEGNQYSKKGIGLQTKFWLRPSELENEMVHRFYNRSSSSGNMLHHFIGLTSKN